MERQDSYDDILREVREHLAIASQDNVEDEPEQALDETDNNILDARYFLRDTEPPSAPQETPAPSSGQKPEPTPGGRKVSLTKVKNWFSRGQGLSEEERTLELQERPRKGRALIPEDHGIAEMPFQEDASPQKGTIPKISFPGLRKMVKDAEPLPPSRKASSSFPSPMPSFNSAEESSAAAGPVTPYSMTKHHVGLLQHLPVVPKEEVAKLPKFLTPNVPEEESHIWHSGRRPSLPLHHTGFVADNGQEASELKHSRQRQPRQYEGDYTNTRTLQSSSAFEGSPAAGSAQGRVPFLHYDETSKIRNRREKPKLEKTSHADTSRGPSFPMISDMEFAARRREEAVREGYYSPAFMTRSDTPTVHQQTPPRPSREPTSQGLAAHTFHESARAVKSRRDRLPSHETLTSFPARTSNTSRSGTHNPQTPTPQTPTTPISQLYHGLQHNSSRMPPAPVPARFGHEGGPHHRLETSPSSARIAGTAGEAGGDGSPTPIDIIEDYSHHHRSSSSGDSNRGSPTRPLFR
ncbi:MAG: hypothetical protein Q9228_003118 [Teloschistes exilis]